MEAKFLAELEKLELFVARVRCMKCKRDRQVLFSRKVMEEAHVGEMMSAVCNDGCSQEKTPHEVLAIGEIPASRPFHEGCANLQLA